MQYNIAQHNINTPRYYTNYVNTLRYSIHCRQQEHTMQYDIILHGAYTFHTTSMRSTRKTANHSVGQLVSKPVSTSADQSIYVGGRPVSKSVSKPVNKCQSTHQLSSQSLGRSGSSQPMSQPVSQWSAFEPVSQPASHSTSQPLSQTANQPIISESASQSASQ